MEPNVKKKNPTNSQNTVKGSKSNEKGGSAEVVWSCRLTVGIIGW